MKTSRSDIERNKQQTHCPNSTWIGFSTCKLKYGDLFLYEEHYTDGSSNWRLARCHGRIRPNHNTSGRRNWLVLAQAMSNNSQFSFERWIDPEDIMEVIPQSRANKHILAFFRDTETV